VATPAHVERKDVPELSHRIRLNVLTEPSSNPKTHKSLKMGYLTAGLHLAPANESGIANLCAAHSPGCAAACIYHSGRASFSPVVKPARIERTRMLLEEPRLFWSMLRTDLMLLQRAARRRDLKPAVRLNVTSDLSWELMPTAFDSIIDEHPAIQFYDYTKKPGRSTPANYHLTFSRSEINERVALRELDAGRNVAVVFAHRVPGIWESWPVIDGDDHDCRWLDPQGVVVGLLAKGKRAKADGSGFVVR
jgi:hypothetical protein